MGLLADIFSTADTAKRRLSGLLADPLGTLALGVTRFGEDQGGLLNMTQNAYPMAGNKTVLNSPQQIANFRKQVADKGAEMAMQAATVWHGSPHKFDKFDSSKIGTGEGAQAYGHGLYLAESPDVAKSYQDALSMDAGYTFGGKQGLSRQQVQDLVNAREGAAYLDGVSKPSMVADHVMDSLSYGNKNPTPRGYKDGSARSKLYGKLMSEIEHTDKGSLYKVDLPDEHIAKMLDWDKPLSQQHPDVQKAVKPLLNGQFDVRGYGGGWGSLEPDANAVRDVFTKSGHSLGTYSAKDADALDFTGSAIVKALGDMNKESSATSKMLKDAGIPGIRYLDAMSREGGGTSNFVVFPGNEGLLRILERNGVPIK